METLIKLNNSTAGRDKLARLLQYLSRFLWHRLQIKNGYDVEKIKSLEYQLSTFRKLLRFGRFWESLYAALPIFREDNSTLRHTIILSKIANSLFLLADHVLWLGRADLCTTNTEKWSRISNKYWLSSITMNLVRDFYELFRIIKDHKNLIVPKSGVNNLKDTLTVVMKTGMILQNNPDVLVDTIKNGCDFFIPLTSLGHVKLSPGTIGLLGTISSIAGLLVVLDPKKKLIPS